MTLTNKVAQFDADSDLVNAWVHGPASGAGSTVTTDSGAVRTPAKLIADNEAELQAVIDLTNGWANGNATATTVLGGVPVSSPAKLIADKETQINVSAASVISNPRFTDYTALRAYTGSAVNATITAAGIVGFFLRSATDVSADNGGTVIVDALGRRWLRNFVGPVHVEWFGAVGGGVADDTIPVIASVAYCYANGTALQWTGIYKTTATIPNFHDVQHIGIEGALKRGASTFKLSQTATDVNELFVSTSTGADTNDGLSVGTPFKSVARAMAALKGEAVLPRLKDGVWRVKITAGTYPESAVFDLPVANNSYLEFIGEVDGSGVPTVVFDGAGLPGTSGLYFTGPKRIKVQDIKAINYRANSVASGVIFANRGVDHAYTVNVHTYNNFWAGINADNIGQFYVEGGIHDANTHYNLRVRGNVGISIGYNGSLPGKRVTLKNGATGIQLRDCSAGHFDFVDILDCATGVWVTNVSRITLNTCTVTNVNVGIIAGQSSTFSYDGTTTFTNVPTTYRHVAGGCNDSTNAGEMMTYDSYQNRFGYGFAQLGAVTPSSNVSHVWGTDRVGMASFAYIVPTGSTPQMVWGDVASPSKMLMLADLANDRFRFTANGLATLWATPTSVISGRDNLSALGSSVSRWTNTYTVNIRPGAGTAIWTSGAGAPEGVISAPVGSMYTRTDGGALTTLYIKESGTGSTGWVAK